MKLLLHTCCAPCSVECIEALLEENFEFSLFWYNPNIHPYTEYRSRRDSLKLLAEERALPLFEENEYGLRYFINETFCPVPKGIGQSSEALRCALCYRMRLEKTAALAKEKTFAAFSTTLLISPYQNHELIKHTGEELAAQYGVEFLYRDFRQRFRRSREEARKAGYYMQKYCGCIFSEEERYLGKKGGA
ncbi:MAG: epoxyqueuosine reductase QueH [Treponema sp.]|nr:epoxyqueuosine reductase QueH [Treponema sp.]